MNKWIVVISAATCRDCILIFCFFAFWWLWFTHGASFQGVYDAHYLHMKQAESGALKRWQGKQKQISSELDE